MTEENRPEGTPADPIQASSETGETGTAVAAAPEEKPEESSKLRQEVEIKTTGPCKKHIRVVVNQDDIQTRMREHFNKLATESNLTGFRPGKAPRRLIEKRFFKDVSQQVKGEVLLASLEQLGEDHDIAPLSAPQINPDKIDLPKEGPLVYEFEVEVRPEFDLPPYKGLKLKRPVKTFTEEDVAETRRRLLFDQGQIVPKENGTADIGDLIVADMTVRDNGVEVGTLKETTLRVERRLAFKDGMAMKFGEQIKGARAGENRVVDVQLSQAAAGGLAGKTVQANVEVKDVKTVPLPELTPEYCEEAFGVPSAGQFDEMLRAALERNLAHEQRRSARMQVLELINATATWDLPEDLLRRQARRALSRRIMEMRSDGISDVEIDKRRRVLEQDILKMTALTLKEHFVLQKIAETEKIDVTEEDLDDEIVRLADQTDESPRKVRARLEKEDMLEALMAEMIERLALDLILDSAQYEDVPLDPEESGTEDMATVEEQAVPGAMTDPTAQPAEEATPASPAP